MPYPTSPARYLAPLALLAAVLATFLVVDSERSVDGASSSSTPTAKVVRKAPSGVRQKAYKVKAGDTLSGIAAKTGVPLETIESLNPDVDANALHAGQSVKLKR